MLGHDGDRLQGRRYATSAPQDAVGSPNSWPNPFWDSKIHGQPYGNFKQAFHKQPKQQVQVEIREGVLHAVQQRIPSSNKQAVRAGISIQHHQPVTAATSRAAFGPGRPKSAPGNAKVPQQQQLQPYQQNTIDMNPKLAELEEQMRHVLHAKAAVHMKEKTVLLQAFAKVLGKAGAAQVAAGDKVDTSQFCKVWGLLGLTISNSQAAGLFNRHGQDVRGRLPVMVFVEALVVGGPRQIMLMESQVQHGAYSAGQPAKHTGKIIYPECKSGVWPPSNWDPSLAARSSKLPEARLELDFVYGYDAHRATSNNLWVNCAGHLVTYAAAVGIVHEISSHHQVFFRGHDDDICCLALAPDRRIAASGQLGKDPTMLVWDSVSLTQLAKLQHGYGYRGIQAICFSSSGGKLACIATDNSHSLFIWDWSRGRKLMERKTQPGAPPAVYGVVWSKFDPNRLVTFGQNHIKFWNLNRPNATGSAGAVGDELTASVDAGVFDKRGTHSVLSAVFLPGGVVLTGSPGGSIATWKGARCTCMTAAHAQGPLVRRPDGSPSPGGVACLVLLEHHRTLLSGGPDGHVLKWDVSSGDLGQCLQRLPLLTPNQQQLQQQARLDGLQGPRLPPAVRALDAMPGNTGVFIAGTYAGDVWEVDQDPCILLYGHQGDLLDCATNPHYPHVFATTSVSGKVAIWNAATHKPIRIFPVGGGTHATCVAFSPDGKQLLVGLDNGGLKAYEFSPDTKQVWWFKAFDSAVDVVRYSPDGICIAAAGHDRLIDIFIQQPQQQSEVPWRRLVRCSGHSSAVKHLDWSADGQCIQSMDQAYELLYFNASTGQQLKSSQRDTAWASYTCLLGFPVMGIWPPDSDGTDINSLDRSPACDLVITADDKGKVKLFNYPCVVQSAPGHCYGGHSSHVTGVRWASNQSYAISVGGHDRSLFQWRFVPPLSKQEKQRRQQQRHQQDLLTHGSEWFFLDLPASGTGA